VIRAVIFDLGGVVLDSPLAAIAAYEEEAGIAPGTINRLVSDSGAKGAWARHERGELDFSRFCEAFEAECADRGLFVDAGELMAHIDRTAVVRPRMLEVIDVLRRAGLKVAGLTNNWQAHRPEGLESHFDVLVESSAEGVRKPEPEIYQRTLERLGVGADQTVMLDDIGSNLKTAAEMGMATIKVADLDRAIEDLGKMLGLVLR
jgi:putative hydrolase of the HAD superfamily